MKKIIFLLLIMVVIMSTSVLGMSQQVSIDNEVILKDIQVGNRYLVGDTVSILADVTGDAFAAASHVLVEGTISDDLNAVGYTIDLLGTVGGDARLIGSKVFVDGVVFREALLIGQSVILSENAKIGHDAYIYGNVIEVNGEYSKNLVVEGDHVYFDGLVQGDMELKASSLELGPDALVVGDLKVSDNLDFDDELVRGDITKIPLEDWAGEKEETGFSVGNLLIFLVMILIIGFVFLAVASQYSDGVGVTSMQRPFHSFITGLVGNIVLSLVGFLLLLTVVGVPLGVLILIIYLGLLILSIPVGAWFLGGLILKIFDLQMYKYMKMFIGAIAYVLIALIPIVGPIVLLIASLIGFGAMVRNFYGRDKPARRRSRRKKKKTFRKRATKEKLERPSKPKEKKASSKKSKAKKSKSKARKGTRLKL